MSCQGTSKASSINWMQMRDVQSNWKHVVAIGHESSNIVVTKKGSLIARLGHRLEYYRRAKKF